MQGPGGVLIMIDKNCTLEILTRSMLYQTWTCSFCQVVSFVFVLLPFCSFVLFLLPVF